MIERMTPWRQSPNGKQSDDMHLMRGRALARLVPCLLVLLVATCLVFTGNAWASATKKADPDTATRKLTFEADDIANRWQFDGSQNNYTRYRWVPDKETGNLAYCINPGVTHGPGEGTQTYPARLLAESDFKDEELYLHCLAALYYAPGGPGYKTENGDGIGRSFFPDADYQGGSFSFRDRFASAHVFMGYCYNDASWEKAFGGASDPSLHEPAAAYKAWFLEHIVPKELGGTGSKSFGAQARDHLNDEDMVANGGYTLDAWKESVYIIMTGHVDDGLPRQDMLTYLSAPTAPLTMQKTPDADALTKGNSAYSLAGAKYSVYADKALKSEIATMTTDAEGKASTGNLVIGTYYVKETKPSTGYLLDKTVHAVKVRKDGGGSFTSKEPPRHLPLTTLLGKVDARTQEASPEGMGTLAGAEFTVRHYAGTYGDEASLPATPTATWTVTTDESGIAKKSIDLPLGTYTVQETRTPKGYQADATVYIGHVVADDSAAQGARLRPANYQAGSVKTAPDFPDYLPVAKEQPKTYGFSVVKNDADLHASSAQGDASLDGAVFSVVNDSEHPVTVNGKSYAKGEECLTVVAEREEGACVARCNGNVLPFGNYLITEKIPPQGYLPNTEWNARIVADDNLDTGYIWEFSDTPCEDQVIRGGISVPKIDHELMEALPLGAATLEGAEISVFLDSNQPAVIGTTSYTKGDCVLKMKTGPDGTCSSDKNALPYGTYTVRETSEPNGYLINGTWEQSVSVRDDGTVITCNPVDDQVKRGDIRFNKVHEDSMERMGRVAFRLTSKTTGESHVVVSDENGSVDTSSSWNPHTRNTNANDDAVGTETNEAKPGTDNAEDPTETIDGSDDGEETGSSDDDSGGTAGDGDSDVDAGYASDSDSSGEDDDDDIQPEPDDETGTDGYPENTLADDPSQDDGADVEIEAASDASEETGSPIDSDVIVKAIADALGADTVSLADRSSFEKARANAEANEDIPFTVTTKTAGKTETRALIMTPQEDGSIVVRDAVTDDEVVAIEPSETSLAGQEAPSISAEVSGVDEDTGSAHSDAIQAEKLDLEAGIWFNGRADRRTEPNDERGALPFDTYSVQELRSSANEGMALVHFDVKVTRDNVNLDMGTVDDRYISLNTELTTVDGSHDATPMGTVSLVDRVEYTGLTPGKAYELRGYLVDKGTGERYGESTTAPFTAEGASGSADVPFEIDGDSAAGKTLVAYQELFEGDELVAEHKDINDLDETVFLPRTEEPETPASENDPEPEPKADPQTPAEETKRGTIEPDPIAPDETSRKTPQEKTATPHQERFPLAKTGDLLGPYLWLFIPLVLGMGATGSYGFWRRRAFAYRSW